MKTTSACNLSNKKAAKILLFFCVMLSFSVTLFAQRPTIASFSPANGAVGTLVTINGTNLGSPTAFSIGGVTALVIKNTGTVLTGFVMPGAVTGAVSLTTSGGTATGSSIFTVTQTPYPSAQQGSKLVGTGNIDPAEQAHSVAVSADGNTAIVGGFNDNYGQGAAWVYTRNGSSWSQQGTKLVGTGNTGVAWQAWSVSLSADGNTAIVGGYQDNNNQGAAWVYTRSGGVWSQQGPKLVGTGNAGAAEQGYSVSLSADGNTAVVGGYQDNGGQGAAWVYTRSNGTWSQQGTKLVGTGNTGAAAQGYSVSLSADGNTVIVGGYGDNSDLGAAWVYTRSSGAWSQQGGKLVGTGNTGAAVQGVSVSLSADGNTAMVGGNGDNSRQGAAWIYVRSAGTWSQQGGKLVGTGNTGAALQGTSVSLSADGNTAIVGGYQNHSNQGAAWVYTRSGSTWGQQGTRLVGTGNSGAAYQGASVALSADGNTAMVGGYADNNYQGAAWVYKVASPAITSFSPASGSVGTLVTINGTNLGSPTAFSIGGATALVINNTGTVLTGFVMPGAVTGAVSLTTSGGTATGSGNFTVTPALHPAAQQGSKLVGTGSTGVAYQGWSVSVSADGNTAIVGGPYDNSRQGAAWVFTRSSGIWSQQGGKLVGSGSTGQTWQGGSVAISADGNTAIVGGAWVYTRSAGAWSQQGGRLVGAGGSVSLSADGNTAIVGGQGDNSGQGAAWVYTRSGGAWSQQGGKLVGTGNTGAAAQGTSVSLSADGNTAIVGGGEDNSGAGAAWVFTRSGNTWSQQGGKLVGAGNSGAAYQGGSVSLSADGNTAIVGGDNDNNGHGAVWVYTRSAGVWSQQGGKLVGTGNSGGAEQGTSVSLSADGNTAIVGGQGDNEYQGAAWVFTRSGNTWSQQGTRLVGDGNTGAAYQGSSVSLSADGITAMVGGYGDNNYRGAAWVFTVASSIATLSNLAISSGTLSPAFAAGTTGYAASVPYSITSVTVTPASSDPSATVTVNGLAVTSGTASGAVALNVGPNTITTVVTAQDGVTKKTYTITVTRESGDDNLSGLTISSGTLSPVFAGGTQNYIAFVGNSVSSLTVTPTTSDPLATVTVNGVAVTSGTASGAITLNTQPRTITIIVTAQDGVTTKTYRITATKPPANAILSGLSVNIGALSPAFAGSTQSYTISVGNAVTSATVTPTTSNPAATVTVNGTPVTSGSASGPLTLNVGSNEITIKVTAQDGVTTKIYTITATRESRNADLSGLTVSSGTLSPVFTSGTQNYNTFVGNGVASVTVTPTTSDPSATGVTVNGIAVTSGTASGPIALNVGKNIITVVVTAHDPGFTKTYTIAITRESGNDNLSALTLSSGTLSPVFSSTVTSYTAFVGYGVSSLTVTPTTSDPSATGVTVNGKAVKSGTASGHIALNAGPNTITVTVTAHDPSFTKTYTITVTRAPSANAILSGLSISAGTLSPAFATETTSYTAAVANSVASLTLTPTTSNSGATVAVNGAAVTSGSASGPLALNVGQNTITTIVTAEDGVTKKNYTVTITRASGGNNPLYQQVSVEAPQNSPQLADDGIIVHPGISPNGDGIDDFLQIDNIASYPDNRLAIMNRSGTLVYEAKGYDNTSTIFDGHSNKTGRMQLPGTYFYSLDYTVNGVTKHKTGFLVLKY